MGSGRRLRVNSPLLPAVMERLRVAHAEPPHPELPPRLDTRSVHAIPIPLLAAIAFMLGLGLGSTQPSIMSLIYATAPAGRAAASDGRSLTSRMI